MQFKIHLSLPKMADGITTNIDQLKELGEGQFIEFKESFDKNFAKELVAFANASGGVIYLGINDAGDTVGFDTNNRLKSQLQDTARNCDPSIVISLIELENILAVEVKEGQNKPYACSSGFYMRMGANSQKMSRDEILALAIKTGKIRFDEQICANFNWKDFDDDKFEYYLKLAGISNKIPKKDILQNLRILTDQGFTYAGILFFAKEPYKYIISSKIRCVHFNDTQRVDILDKKVVDKGIIGNIEFAVAYLKERIPVRYDISDLKRKEFPEYPIEAYRESIVNAIIHFDYFLGDTIAIEKLVDRIIINNKEELLFPIEDFGKRSEARNRLLADLLSRTNYMEKAGTGIKRVQDACKANRNKLQFEFSDAIRVNILSNVNDTDHDTDHDTDRKEMIIKLLIINNSMSIMQLAKNLNVSKSTILRDMDKLKTEKRIERIGSEKGGYWKVND